MRIDEVDENLGSKAGLVPYTYKDNVPYVLLMKPSNPNWGGTQFQIAKGRVEQGEDLVTAAFREGAEELGVRTVDLANNIRLVSSEYNDGAEETSGRPYRFYVYAVELKEANVTGKPHFETSQTRWITQDEVPQTRADHQEILSRLFAMLGNKELGEARFARNPVDQEIPFDDEHTERGHRLRLKGEPWRGPHEGRMLTLMLRGLKPAALLDDADLRSFKPHIDSGKFVVGEFDIDWHGTKFKQYVVTQHGQEWRIKRIAKMFTDRPQYKNINLWHARLGVLLGYSNADIKKFLTDR